MSFSDNITADFSSGSDGPIIQATYSGRCMAEDLCSFGGISPGDWIQPADSDDGDGGGGWVHPLCAQQGHSLRGSGEKRGKPGYQDVHANDKPTRYAGTSLEDMGF